MRKAIHDLIQKTLILKFKLPFESIDKSSLTFLHDYCFESSDLGVTEAIYNSIVDYCLNDFEIDLSKLDQNQIFAIQNRLRYDEDADLETQLKYGFFGESLFNILLKVYFHSNKIIAKGHFYSSIDKSEPKGYDSFHFLDNKGQLEFWMGESKMYTSLPQAINKVLVNINQALSVKYYENNIRAILQRSNDLDSSCCQPLFEDLVSKLKNENMEVVMRTLKERKVKLIYPILLTYNSLVKDYNDNIIRSMTYIQNQINKSTINNEIVAELLFILVPVENVTSIKKEVLKWISDQKPII